MYNLPTTAPPNFLDLLSNEDGSSINLSQPIDFFDPEQTQPIHSNPPAQYTTQCSAPSKLDQHQMIIESPVHPLQPSTNPPPSFEINFNPHEPRSDLTHVIGNFTNFEQDFLGFNLMEKDSGSGISGGTPHFMSYSPIESNSQIMEFGRRHSVAVSDYGQLRSTDTMAHTYLNKPLGQSVKPFVGNPNHRFPIEATALHTITENPVMLHHRASLPNVSPNLAFKRNQHINVLTDGPSGIKGNDQGVGPQLTWKQSGMPKKEGVRSYSVSGGKQPVPAHHRISLGGSLSTPTLSTISPHAQRKRFFDPRSHSTFPISNDSPHMSAAWNSWFDEEAQRKRTKSLDLGQTTEDVAADDSGESTDGVFNLNVDSDYPNITEADIEAAKKDSSAIPRRQKLRYEGDDYTPKWVRYTGQPKEGYCDSCQPGKWLQLKNSAYWYHKQFFHGISSVSGKAFVLPLEQRDGEHDVIEGLCHQCHQYVPICNAKRKNSVLWYRHAHKCHIYDKPKTKAVKRNSIVKKPSW